MTDDYMQSIRKYPVDASVRDEELLVALEKAVLYGGHSEVFSILGLALHNSVAVREKSWSVLSYLLAGITPEQLIKIDAMMRQYQSDDGLVERIDRFTLPPLVAGLLSSNKSGYVRECALRQVVTHFGGQELPFILLRCTDWVSSIKTTAERAIEERLHLNYSGHFANNLALIQRLNNFRVDTVFRAIQPLLKADTSVQLLSQLSSEDLEVRLYALKLLTKHTDREVRRLAITNALANDSSAVKLAAIKVAAELLTTEELVELSTLLTKFLDSRVRIEVLRVLAEKQIVGWQEKLREAAFDRSSGVRDLVRYYLPDIDTAIYESALLEPDKAAVAIKVLSDLNILIDPVLINRLVTEGKSSVRAAAFSYKLQMEDNKSATLRQALADVSPRCTRAALFFLLKEPNALPPDELLNYLRKNNSSRTRALIVRIFSQLGLWDRLPFLLQAKLEFPDIESSIDDALSQWLKSRITTYTLPSKARREECLQLLNQAMNHLDPTMTKQIQFALNDR